AADRKRGGAPGRAAGAVDVEDFVLWNAKIVAKRRHPRLRLAQILLLDDRDLALEVFERFQPAWMETRLVPLAAIERRVLVGISAHGLQPFEDRALALAGRHRLAVRKPVAAVWRWKIIFVVCRRKGPGLHRFTADRARRRAVSGYPRSPAAACPAASPRAR